MEWNCNIEVAGDKPGSVLKRSVVAKVTVHVPGKVTLSGWSRESSLEMSSKDFGPENFVLHVKSMSNNVVFTEASLVRHEGEKELTFAQMQIAIPIGEEGSATLDNQLSGKPGELKRFVVSIRPHLVEKKAK